MTNTTTTEQDAPLVRRPFGPLDALFLYLIGALALLLALTLLVPRLIGLDAYAVSSVSMEPTLRQGDLIFVRTTPLNQLAEGNIVTYQTAGGVLTHRVYSVEDTLLRTKADASFYLDPAPVYETQLLGRVLYRIPLLGHVAHWLGGEGGGA